MDITNTKNEKIKSLDFRIVNKNNAIEAIHTQNEIFPEDDATIHILIACDLDFLKQNIKICPTVNKVNYYLAYYNDDIVGITGLYTYSENSLPNECWLGWYGVRTKYRGYGFGKIMLEWSIDKALSEGYDTLRLYTTSYYKEAMDVYKKRGFISEEYVIDNNEIIIYSIALSQRPLELLEGRFINILPEMDLCKISKEQKLDLLEKFKIGNC